MKLLCEGVNPTDPAVDFGPVQIQNLRNQIAVRLAHEYITQQAIAKNLIDPRIRHKPPLMPPRTSPLSPRLPAPFPLDVNPLPMPHMEPLHLTTPIAHTPPLEVEYCPSINSWGLWQMNNGLYYIRKKGICIIAWGEYL